MQTFLPLPSLYDSLRVLDYRRQGKQRVESAQLVNAIAKYHSGETGGWINHPAAVMWRHHTPALKAYCNVNITLWLQRGFKNEMPLYLLQPMEYELPWWWGDEELHASHRSALLYKNEAFYRQFGWNESPGFPKHTYVWPDVVAGDQRVMTRFSEKTGKREVIRHVD